MNSLSFNTGKWIGKAVGCCCLEGSKGGRNEESQNWEETIDYIHADHPAVYWDSGDCNHGIESKFKKVLGFLQCGVPDYQQGYEHAPRTPDHREGPQLLYNGG